MKAEMELVAALLVAARQVALVHVEDERQQPMAAAKAAESCHAEDLQPAARPPASRRRGPPSRVPSPPSLATLRRLRARGGISPYSHPHPRPSPRPNAPPQNARSFFDAPPRVWGHQGPQAGHSGTARHCSMRRSVGSHLNGALKTRGRA
jgi:hypothetical protein